jgi:hypothetical protein
MPRLTQQQLSALIADARAQGLDEATIEGMTFALLDNAADLDGASRLAMARDLMADAEGAAVDTFVASFAAIRQSRLAQAARDLDGISDDEWARLIAPDDSDARA